MFFCKCLEYAFTKKNLKNFEFWEIESFENKTINDIVCDNFYKDICFKEGESRYQVQLSCKDDHDLLLNNCNHCKTQIRNLVKRFPLNINLLDIDNGVIKKVNRILEHLKPFRRSNQVKSITCQTILFQRKADQQKFVWFLMQVQMLLDLP